MCLEIEPQGSQLIAGESLEDVAVGELDGEAERMMYREIEARKAIREAGHREAQVCVARSAYSSI